MNDVYVGDEKLISTTRASELSGYSQDYVGQLCREEKIDCRRISGHWYVNQKSLQRYQKSPQTADAPTDDVETKKPYGIKVGNVRDDTFVYDDVEYIATSRAAELTGYAQDYVGQLARNGEVAARKVGRRWFVGRKVLIEHKKKSDAMLAAVQAESAGLGQAPAVPASTESVDNETGEVEVEINKNVEPGDIHFNVRYVSESDKELLPRVPVRATAISPQYAPRDIPSSPPKRDSAVTTPTQQQIAPSNSQKALERESRMVRKAIVREDVESRFEHTPRKTKPKRRFFSMFLAAGLLVSAAAVGYYAFINQSALLAYFSNIERIIPAESFEGARDLFGEYVPGKEIRYSSE